MSRQTNRRKLLGGMAGAALVGTHQSAAAADEVTNLRFVRQLGIGYLPIYVIEAQNLIDKHAKALGLPGVTATFRQVTSPAIMNDMLLANDTDIVVGGFPPFVTIWDKTRGTFDIKCIAALNCQPLFILTTNPNVKSVADFSGKDRIAVPAVGVSTQAVCLQMIAGKLFGPKNIRHFDAWTVGFAHADAAAALIGGKSELTAHFSSMPLQQEELRHSHIRRIGTCYDATDGPSTTSNIWATRKFYEANPKTMKALVAALDEAIVFLRKNPLEAAKMYIELDKSKLEPAFVAKLVEDPEMVWELTPRNTVKVTDFMFETGRIKNRPASWKDMFFEGIHDRQGS